MKVFIKVLLTVLEFVCLALVLFAIINLVLFLQQDDPVNNNVLLSYIALGFIGIVGYIVLTLRRENDVDDTCDSPLIVNVDHKSVPEFDMIFEKGANALSEYHKSLFNLYTKLLSNVSADIKVTVEPFCKEENIATEDERAYIFTVYSNDLVIATHNVFISSLKPL